jgi:hypothetical protein
MLVDSKGMSLVVKTVHLLKIQLNCNLEIQYNCNLEIEYNCNLKLQLNCTQDQKMVVIVSECKKFMKRILILDKIVNVSKKCVLTQLTDKISVTHMTTNSLVVNIIIGLCL